MPDQLLLPTDHYIMRKLSNELLPLLICARGLRKQWFVHLSMFNSYASDVLAALAGLGIGSQLVALANGKLSPGTNAVEILHQALPGPWFAVGVIALVLWIAVRIIVHQEDVVARALLARDCGQTMRALNQDLLEALSDREPMPAVTRVQMSVNDQVHNAIKNRIWPYDPPVPRLDIFASELGNELSEIRTRFMPGWAPPPPETQ